MKPTVIAGGSGENPQNHPGANGSNNNNVPPQNNNVRTNDDNNNAYANARTMPQHQTGFGYLDDDDIFSDAGLRARLNRWRDPFGFGARKRCGNEPQDDPYNRYFRDETDFFPGFGQQFEPRGRRRVTPQYDAADQDSDFFHHIPAEFRHYIPDSFGFSKFGAAPGSPRAQQPPSQPQPQQQQQHYPPQYYENYPQQEQQPSPQQQPPHYQQQQSQETQAKPVYCDASIQTDNEGPLTPGQDDQSQNLNQHGLRNTVDLGQKSPQEEERSPRAHSAPPTDPNYPNQNFASSSSQASHGPGGAEATAYAYSSDPNQQNAQAWSSSNAHPVNAQASASSHPQQRNTTSQGTSVPTPPPRQNAPQFQQQPRQQAHPQAPPQPQPQQQQQRPQPNSQQDSGTYIRHVPIFIEGRSEPPCTQNKQPAPPQRAPPQQQAPPQNVPPPQQQQQQQQQPKPHPHRPTPLDTQQPTPPEADPNQVSYTPSTTASIQKIQDIQRDVMHLMTEVEKFTGSRNDKEYMFLDEMLTRNLLKLDTIDTNGKDSIRLARREAIKCIQASINVLEAKAEGNAKTAQSTVMEVDANSPPAYGSSEDQAQVQDQQAAVQTSVGETQTDAKSGSPASEETKKTEDTPAEPVVLNKEKEKSPNLEDAQAVPISADNPTKEAAKKKIVKKLKKVEQKEKQEEAAAATESPGANSAVGSPLPETATETVALNTKSQ